MFTETILNVFPTHDDLHRLVIAMEQQEQGPSRLVLRQETFSDDVGWFVQSRITVEPEQVQGLRMSLGSAAPRGVRPMRAELAPAHDILPFPGRDSAVRAQVTA